MSIIFHLTYNSFLTFFINQKYTPVAYTYQLSYLSRSRYIEPKSIGKITVAKEQDEAFFREKISGNLEVSGDDYQFLIDANLHNSNCCQEIILNIYSKCQEGESLFWSGYFSLLDIEWDYDNLTATVGKINVRDAYDIVFRGWHLEINWLNYTEINPFKYQGLAIPNLEYNPTNSKVYVARDFTNSLRYLVQSTFSDAFDTSEIAKATKPNFSKFLTSDINPVTKKANVWKDVYLVHVSDAKRPGATNIASRAVVTLKDVMSELKKLANLYWYIDSETGQFKIEHITFFNGLPENLIGNGYTDLTQTLDLTTESFKDDLKGKNRVKTNSSALKGIEGIVLEMNRSVYNNQEAIKYFYKPSEEISSAFMSYSSMCVPLDEKGQKTEEIKSISMFMTDFMSCVYYPEAVSDDGFVLVHSKWIDGASDVVSEATGIEKLVIRNGALSASRLYRDYGLFGCSFSYGMFSPIKEGALSSESNSVSIPKRAKSTKLVRQYSTIELSNCCGIGYDFSGYIKHPLYDKCIVERVEVDTVTQTVEISIISDSPCSNIPVPDEDSEEEEPDPNCPPYGQFTRKEITTKNVEVAPGVFIAMAAMYMYYDDGKCGEYAMGPYII